MVRADAQAFAALVGLLVLAGCTGGEGEPTETSPMANPPAPKVVYQKELEACPGGGLPVQTSPIQETFEIPEGYDEIVLTYHDSGEGSVNAEVRTEENQQLWGESRTVNSAPVVCGGHAHEGGGVTLPAEPGAFRVSLSYTGAVSVHLDIVARKSGTGDDADHMDH